MSKNSEFYSTETIKEHLQDIHDGAFVDDEDLQEMLGQAWYQLVPEEKNLSQTRFISTCLEDKDKYLVALNGEYTQSPLSLIR